MLEKLRALKETESDLYEKFGDSRNDSIDYLKAQDELLTEKRHIENTLKHFRFLVEDAPELFEDSKAKQIDEWLILASIKLEDL